MRLVIDVGNTRTKWALADAAGSLSEFGVCMNADIAKAKLPLEEVTGAIVSNVAGSQMAEALQALLKPLKAEFLKPTALACGVKNNYLAPEKLGTDRWAAVVAAWQHTKHATVVVNAGTAITIDAISPSKKLAAGLGANAHLAVFLGGTIMPGLTAMQNSLISNAAQLQADKGIFAEFSTNTADAIESGCLNAVAGAIYLMFKRLEKQSGWLPKLVISGGDAHKIAQCLNQQDLKLGVKQVIMMEDLVLRGLVLLSQ